MIIFQDILHEISMMRQCESEFVVKYYGSYFKNSDLWIVMEYCAARSVSDMMRLFKKPFDEDKIQTVLYYTLKGVWSFGLFEIVELTIGRNLYE